MTTTCSAPGKLIIAGEYAVLEGHPTLVAAVDRRAIATLTPGRELTVSALGLGPLRVDASGHDVVIEGDDEGRLLLVSAVLDEAHRNDLRLPRGHLTLDTSAFFFDGEKLGLGSSAAAAVALSAEVLAKEGALDVERVFHLADTAHAVFSGKRGSGVDVAASTYGGVLRFSREAGEGVLTEPWPLCPRGLDVVVAFAGVPTSTRGYLATLRRFEQRDSRAYDRAIDDVAYASLELLGASSPGEDPRVFLAAIDRCRRSLLRLGDKTGLDIVSAAHRRIAKIAQGCGGAAKPSGAGGGDVAVAFVPAERKAELERALEAAGFPVVPLAVGDAGVRVDAA